METGQTRADVGTDASYLELEIDLGPRAGDHYPVTVHSPLGDAEGTLRLPFGDEDLVSRLKDVEIAVLRSSAKVRSLPGADEQAIQDLGGELFDALFSGTVRDHYIAGRTHARSEDKGLRIKIVTSQVELQSLPWELLYDAGADKYICLSRNTPLVRYTRSAEPIAPVTVNPPLRMLAMTASPNGLPALDVDGERSRIEKATLGLRDNGLLTLRWIADGTAEALQAALREGPFHIFHFAGHGGFDERADEGVIILNGKDGRPNYLGARALGALLEDQPSLRLVVLNACEGARGGRRDIFSSAASILLQHGIPAVLAMQYPITDWAATTFIRTFYESVAQRLPIDAATAEARKSILIAKSIEWATPVLFMRSPDGMIFDIQRANAAPPAERPGERRPVSRGWLIAALIASTLGVAVVVQLERRYRETSRTEPPATEPVAATTSAPPPRELPWETASAPLSPPLTDGGADAGDAGDRDAGDRPDAGVKLKIVGPVPRVTGAVPPAGPPQ